METEDSAFRARFAPKAAHGKGTGKASKGFIFSIDATLGLFVLVLFLVSIVFLSAQADLDPYAKLQMTRIGNDALLALDRSGIMLSGNRTLIDGALESVLPDNMGARLQISTHYYDSGAFVLANVSEYGGSPPNGSPIYSTRMDFVALKNSQVVNYSIARLDAWQG